jgi:uncharacterized DUF497 family protein
LLVRFTWDPTKARSNLRKHGVSFVEAITTFADPLAFILDDGADAGRLMIVGESVNARLLVTVYVEVDPDGDTLRVISARRATRHERRRYEDQS